jgi:hypothetical protein
VLGSGLLAAGSRRKECFASVLNFVFLGQHCGEIWIALGAETGCILAKILKLKDS